MAGGSGNFPGLDAGQKVFIFLAFFHRVQVLTALKIGNFNMQQSSNFMPNMDRRLAIPDIEKNNLKLLGIGEKLLSQYQMNDDTSQSNNSLEASKHLKSEGSESDNESESGQEEEPLNAIKNA